MLIAQSQLDVRVQFGDDCDKASGRRTRMRWDDFRRSDNVEDDRDAAAACRRRRLRHSGRRRRPRHRHRRRARPDRLGARHRSEHPDRRRGNHQRRRRTTTSSPIAAERARTGTPTDQTGPVRRRRARQYRGHLDRNLFTHSGQHLSARRGCVLYPGGEQGGCGFAQAAMGPFYCPTRPAHLSRHLVLPRHAGALPRLQRQGLRVRRGLRDRARGRPSRAEPARHPAEGASTRSRPPAARPTANRIQVRVELQADCFAGVWANHSEQALEFDRAGRRRGGAADGVGDRRRPAAEAVAGLRGAGHLHPRHFGAAPALVHQPA